MCEVLTTHFSYTSSYRDKEIIMPKRFIIILDFCSQNVVFETFNWNEYELYVLEGVRVCVWLGKFTNVIYSMKTGNIL